MYQQCDWQTFEMRGKGKINKQTNKSKLTQHYQPGCKAYRIMAKENQDSAVAADKPSCHTASAQATHSVSLKQLSWDHEKTQ